MSSVLLVDDDDALRITLREILEIDGYEVVEACDAVKGIKLYRERPLDIIITDIMMKGESGITVIEKLRRDYPDVKIIAISGAFSMEKPGFLRMAKILGANKVLFKPFGRAEMLTAIEELLSEKV